MNSTTISYLPVHGGHKIYFATYGSSDHPAILNVHGGPGLRSKEKYARQFDVTKFYVITFDQRGCGQSTFRDKLANNTLQHIVADMETLRQHLGVTKWFLNGGSWGSTVCLAYAEQYPDKVAGLMLASTFLGDFKRMNWLHGGSHEIAETCFPDDYNEYKAFLAEHNITERKDLVTLVERLADGTPEDNEGIVHSLVKFERRLYVAEKVRPFTGPVADELISAKMIYLHYASNRFFTREGQFSRQCTEFKDIPMILVHGDQDRVCPLVDIEDFVGRQRNTTLTVLRDNGHSFSEVGKRLSEESYAEFLATY